MNKRTWKTREVVGEKQGDFRVHTSGAIEIFEFSDRFSVCGGKPIAASGGKLIVSSGYGKTIVDALEEYRSMLRAQLRELNGIIKSGDLPEFKKQTKETENGQAPF